MATLGGMVSLCESVSLTCCGPAVQSAGKPETPWLFASVGLRKHLAVTVSSHLSGEHLLSGCAEEGLPPGHTQAVELWGVKRIA